MKEYEFTLSFLLQNPAEDPAVYEEALFGNGCDDALIGIGSKGSIGLMFTREAGSAQEAISSAVYDVMRSIPSAELCEAQPDLSGLSDIAEIMGCSRQNIRKLVLAESSTCPPPVHSGHPMLWHLCDVLVWLQQDKNYEIEQNLIDVAKITKGLNTSRAWHQVGVDMQQQVETMTAVGQRLAALTA